METSPAATSVPFDRAITTFLGRRKELARLAELHRGGHRLVTLLGPGGMGKTRLALRFADGMAREGARVAIVFCDLTRAQDLAAVVTALAAALEVVVAGGADPAEVLDGLAHGLGGRGATLVILDNCEQVVIEAGLAVRKLLDAAPGLSFLVTSRVALGVAGERLYDVQPLSLPTSTSEPLASDAVQLFVDRARLVRDAFEPLGDELSAVVELVSRLDGAPLAIEIVAARADVLAPSGILARLGEAADLEADDRRGPDRQRSLRATFDWSFDLLAPAERAALAQASVFPGSFSLEAAERIFELGRASVLETLKALRRSSWLRATAAEPTAEVRFSMVELVRAYAAEQLARSRDGPALRARFRATYLDLGGALLARASTDSRAALALEVEFDNFLSVHDAALAADPVDPESARAVLGALDALSPTFERRGPIAVYRARLDASLAPAIVAEADAASTAPAFWKRGRVKTILGDWASAAADFEAARGLAEKTGLHAVHADALRWLGSTARRLGHPEKSRDFFDRAIAVARRADPGALGAALIMSAQFDQTVGRLEQARVSLEEARTFEASLRARDRGLLFASLGLVHQELGAPDEARPLFERSVELAREAEDRRFLAWYLGILGAFEQEAGKFAIAVGHYEEALGLFAEIGERDAEPKVIAQLGGSLAALGDAERGEALLDDAERRIRAVASAATDPGTIGVLAAIAAHRGQVDLARARAARGAERAEHEARARRRLVEAESQPIQSDVSRLAKSCLERALRDLPAPRVDDDDRALIVAADGRWFQPPGGGRVDLSRRKNLRSVLAALVGHRLEAPGMPLAVDVLIRRGWPDQRIDRDAAKNRIRVAMARLREQGLGDAIRNAEGGYLLDEHAVVALATSAPRRRRGPL